jgi:hypothetical protein
MINVFSRPSDSFKESLENPSIILSIIIVLIPTIIFSALGFLLFDNIIASGIIFTSFFINWIVFSIVYWVFSLIFNPKKKMLIESNFLGVLTATSKLWLFLIIIGLLIIISTLGNLITIFSGIIITILLILLFVYTFVLMKTILETNNKKTFIAWLLAIILYSLINSIAFSIIIIVL